MTEPADIPIYTGEKLRTLAEERIGQAKTDDALSETEVRHLLHELQVHQIELEIQNEELRDSQQQLLQTYERLKRSQERLYSLYHEAPVGYVTLNSKGTVLQANAHLAEMCGRALGWIEGRQFVDLLYPADHAQFRFRFMAFFRSPEGKSMELRLNSMREGFIHVLFKGRIAQPTRGANTAETSGELGNHTEVHFSITDITQSKWAQERWEKERKRLEEIIAGTSEGFWLVDPQFRTVQVNTALCQMLGYTPEEMAGRYPWEFTDDNNAIILQHQQALAKTLNHRTYEIELLTKAGIGIPTLCNSTTIYTADGEIEAVFAFITNISERKDYEARLIAARRAAETANQAKSSFLANMSHELRTPLNAVLGYAQILEHDLSLGELQRQGVTTIRHSGEHLLSLINDVLDLAKVEAGHLELYHHSFALAGFFAELHTIFSIRAAEKGLEFHYSTTGKLPTEVNSDEKRLRQICMNLLNNAIKFTENGNVKLEVSYAEGSLIITVTDTGIGIPIDMREQIFKPFTQTGEDRYKQQGTGLGLAISRNLVERMGGKIELDSQIKVGSRFTVSIPVSVITFDSTSQVQQPSNILTGLQRTDGIYAPLQILVVDDIVENRAVLRGLLEPLGFIIQEALSGDEALRITAQQAFDLIFMDLVMPEMDGLTTTRHLLERPDRNNKLIVALTARAFAEDNIASNNAGCRDYLVKPIDRSALLHVLQKHLPIQWEYSTNSQAVSTAPLIITPFTDIQRETLADLVRRGAINDIITYLEKLLATPNCPGQAQILLSLANGFRLSDMRRLLETDQERDPGVLT